MVDHMKQYKGYEYCIGLNHTFIEEVQNYWFFAIYFEGKLMFKDTQNATDKLAIEWAEYIIDTHVQYDKSRIPRGDIFKGLREWLTI